jgi:hypothetical protein
LLLCVTCLWWDLVPAYAFSYTIPAGHCLRDAPESTGALFARRETAGYHDEIYLDGFDDSCHATWARKSSFIVPGGLSITARVTGDPLIVLHTVVSDWPRP